MKTEIHIERDDKQIDFFSIKESLMLLLNSYSERLGIETYDAVKHYIDYDEYEMAYEGLFIDLMEINFNPREIDFEKYLEMGILLNLNKESYFSSNFWLYFNNYISKAI